MPVLGGTDSVIPFGNFKLEVAFASGPDDAAPTWTDVTSYWRLASQTQITRGRNSEQDDIQPGILSLALDNTDGRFTAGNTGSPYYPNVKIRKQIRLTYTPAYSGASTYPVFAGHVDEWPTEWPTGDDLYSEALVTASDRTKRLGLLLPLRPVPQEAVLVTGPFGYWPMGDPQGSTVAANIATGQTFGSLGIVQAGTGGVVDFGAGTGVPTDGQTAPIITQVDGVNGKYLNATGRVPAVVCGVGVCINTTDTDGVVFQLGTRFGTITVDSCVSVFIDSGVAKVFYLSDAFPTTQNLGVTLNDGHTHDVSVRASNSTCDVYVDGVLATTAINGTFSRTFTNLTVCGGSESMTANGDLLSATVSHVRVLTAISGADLTDQANAALNGYAGERSDQRIAHIAKWAGMSSFLSLDTGASTSISHIDTTSRTALDVMKDVAATENGQVFGSRDGKIAFHSRSRRYNAASAMTVSTTQQDVGAGLKFRINDQYLVNDVEITSPASPSVIRKTDATSITDYGYARQDVTVYTTSTSEASGAASWRVSTRSTPLPRAEQLTIDLLAASSSSRLTALGLDISSRITLSGLPATAPASTADLFIEGYTETIQNGPGGSEWTRTYNTSPASVAGNVWQVEVAGHSELGNTTRLAY